jgi:hypothetical protein
MNLNSPFFDAGNIYVNKKDFQKMAFITNALEQGWKIRKTKKNKYIFTKKHEGKKEVFSNSYLDDFVQSNINIEFVR